MINLESTNINKYVNILLWQGVAYFLQVFSLFFVVPYLTNNREIYGIYLIVISISTYLNYGDIGFLSSSQKYATEAFAKNDEQKEKEFLGFGVFIISVIASLFMLFLFLLSRNPNYIIKGLENEENRKVASTLILTLCLFIPVAVFKRVLNIVFDIRLASHQFQRLFLINTLLNIVAVQYFFDNQSYKITEYFLFSQVLNLFTCLLAATLLYKNFKFNILSLFSHVKFKKHIYKKARNLAYSGLLLMISWFLFYEIDQIVIGKYLGSEKVAIYGIAFTFSVFFRGLYGILFNPFMIRANYFMGLGKIEELKVFIYRLIIISAPLTILPTIALSLVSPKLILCWVGTDFQESTLISRYSALLYSLMFITSSINIYLIVIEKVRESVIAGILTPILFWGSVFYLMPEKQLLAFAMMKFMLIVLLGLFYLIVAKYYLKISLKQIFLELFRILIFPLSFLIISFILMEDYLPAEKSKTNLIFIITFSVLWLLCSFFILLFTSKGHKLIFMKAFRNITSPKK